VLGAKKLLVDVTIPRATAPSTLADRTLRNAGAGACTAAAEKAKRDKYEELCKHRGMTFIPFVIESYGGVGPAARELLLHLASASGELDARSFLGDALIRLSVELQRGSGACVDLHLSASQNATHSRTRELGFDVSVSPCVVWRSRDV
jgi:hypothetical protein